MSNVERTEPVCVLYGSLRLNHCYQPEVELLSIIHEVRRKDAEIDLPPSKKTVHPVTQFFNVEENSLRS